MSTTVWMLTGPLALAVREAAMVQKDYSRKVVIYVILIVTNMCICILTHSGLQKAGEIIYSDPGLGPFIYHEVLSCYSLAIARPERRKVKG